MRKIVKLTESDLVRIVKRVINENDDLNDPLKDARGNKFWKELKPELQRLGFRSLGLKRHKQISTFEIPYPDMDSTVETMVSKDNNITISYPPTGDDFDQLAHPNWVNIQFLKQNQKTKINTKNGCFNTTPLQPASKYPETGVWDNSYGGYMKVWCKKEIIDTIKTLRF